ncbi:MAG: exodeoxyribonuclease VII large subunit [Pseudomonadota bacterium]
MTTLSNVEEFSVSALSAALKREVENRFGHVRVRGEISGFKRAASGHLYMALKDDRAVLDAVCWRGTAGRLGFDPEDGLEVIATGKLTTYPGRSKYQIVVDHMEIAGEGALMALLEKRKKALEAEGLFAAERKKPTPFLPKVIGVVTSPTGAVIRDILHRLSDRAPSHVLVAPVKVQGEGAAQEIARAITAFNALADEGPVPRPDLIIVARGGGSIEDLWAFNEEIVVRAAAASRIPLISAVGHETDTTLIDYASDLRAPTPTAAAEKAVPVLSDLKYTVGEFAARLDRVAERTITQLREQIALRSRALPRPYDLIANAAQRLDDTSERLPRGLGVLVRGADLGLKGVSARLRPEALNRQITTLATHADTQMDRLERSMAQTMQHRLDRLVVTAQAMRLKPLINRVKASAQQLEMAAQTLSKTVIRHMERGEGRLDAAARILEASSFRRTLERGFALIETADEPSPHLISSAADGETKDRIRVRFHDGSIIASPEGPREPFAKEQSKRTKPAPKSRQTATKKEQGDLFS